LSTTSKPMPPQISLKSCGKCVLWPKIDERPGLRRCPAFGTLTRETHGSACIKFAERSRATG
jgi:hypothetical protein